MTHRTSFLSLRRIGGFTLVELMITVVVLAIIVGIAVPSYQAQVRKSRRADARNAILDLAGREERFLSISNSYSQLPADMGYGGLGFPVTVNNGYYQLTVTVPDPAQPGVTPSYIITATSFGPQVSDTDCGTFTVNQLGQQTARTSGLALNTATCWGI
jgi:type IV pilus assembly protein PilE